MSLFKELKRRNVFRVAAAYLVSAWLIAQIADLVLENIGAPRWAMQSLLLGLAIGFFVALAISWAYEMTPDGIKRERDVLRDASIVSATGRKLDYITLIAVVCVIALLAWQRLFPPTSARPSPSGATTVAVLPFVNMSANHENEYFSDGISEELLNILVRVEGLQVASRTSAFSFKNKKVSIPEIASALGVDHIIEGSVRRAGQQVRITAQLIDVDTDRHLWSQTYTRDLSDVFAIQDEIATAIAGALELTLLGNTANRKTQSIQAYDLYLLGRHHFHLRTPESLPKAIDFFTHSIALDPLFAPAYSGLADAYALIFQYGDYDEHEAFAKSNQNALKAVELDPLLAEGHASLGLSLAIRGQFQEARAHYRRAIELNPDYSMAHMWLGTSLFAHPDEALKSFRAAEKVDPLHPIIAENIGTTLTLMGRYDEAAAHFDRAIKNSPDTIVLYYSRSNLEFVRGDFVEAYRWARRGVAIDPQSPYALEAIIYAETDLGNFERAEEWIKRLEKIAPNTAKVDQTRFSLYEALGKLSEMERIIDRNLDAAPGAVHFGVYFGAASVKLRREQPTAALALLDGLEEEDVGRDGYVTVLVLRTIAYWQLGATEQVGQHSEQGLQQLQKLRSGGLNQPWMSEVESIFLATQGRRAESLAALQRAFDQGLRNIYGYSAEWIIDRLHGDDPDYLVIRNRIHDDVANMQAAVASELAICQQQPAVCTLAQIDDVQ